MVPQSRLASTVGHQARPQRPSRTGSYIDDDPVAVLHQRHQQSRHQQGAFQIHINHLQQVADGGLQHALFFGDRPCIVDEDVERPPGLADVT